MSLYNGGSDITEYKVYMDSGSLSDDMEEVLDYDGVSTTYQATSLSSGTKYRFSVTAVNAIGESDHSKEVRFAAASLPNKPATLIHGTASTSTQIKLEWADEDSTNVYVTPITGYLVQVYDDEDNEWQTIWNGAGRAEVLTFTYVVTEGEEYEFRHLAYNQNGASSYSDSLVTFACVLPTGLAAPTWDESTISSITVYWDPPTDNGGCPVEYYDVKRNTGNSDAVSVSVHASELLDLSSVTGLVVTDFPASSEGKDFKFTVTVFT